MAPTAPVNKTPIGQLMDYTMISPVALGTEVSPSLPELVVEPPLVLVTLRTTRLDGACRNLGDPISATPLDSWNQSILLDTSHTHWHEILYTNSKCISSSCHFGFVLSLSSCFSYTWVMAVKAASQMQPEFKDVHLRAVPVEVTPRIRCPTSNAAAPLDVSDCAVYNNLCLLHGMKTHWYNNNTCINKDQQYAGLPFSV